MASLSGRDHRSLFDVTVNALGWPETLVVYLFGPTLFAKADASFQELETMSDVGKLFQKYCSDLTTE